MNKIRYSLISNIDRYLFNNASHSVEHSVWADVRIPVRNSSWNYMQDFVLQIVEDNNKINE
jgi:hypothetical protein